jgi:hypothetical protein
LFRFFFLFVLATNKSERKWPRLISFTRHFWIHTSLQTHEEKSASGELEAATEGGEEEEAADLEEEEEARGDLEEQQYHTKRRMSR